MWNFGDMLETVARASRDDAPAFLHGTRAVPWRAAKVRMGNLAAGLLRRGAVHGDKVAFYLRNGAEYGELSGACFLAGLVHANVNYRYGPEELRYIIDNSDAAVLVYSAEFRDKVEAIRTRIPRVRVFVEVGGAAAAPFAERYEALAGDGDGTTGPVSRSADDHVLVYTGGTTGMPKGVVYRQGDIAPYLLASSGLFASLPQSLEELAAFVSARGSATARYMPVCPQMHATGFFVTMWTLLTGGCVVTTDGPNFDPRTVWRAVETCKVTNMAIVGDAFARPLLRELEASPAGYDLSSLVGIGSSGAMWSSEVKRGLLSHLPRVTLIDIFASSEAFGMGRAVTTRDGQTETAKFVLGENAIVIDDDDKPLAPRSGLTGRLAVGGIQPLGYYKDPEKTARTFRMIGGRRYSVPGDHVRLETDGSLTLLGRGNHCINTAGEKVFPEEVEETLKQNPFVEDALVLGTPDPHWGQAVTAVVALLPGAEFDERNLRDFVRERLAGYKVPKRIVAAPRASLRGPNGKADYAAARKLVLGETENPA